MAVTVSEILRHLDGVDGDLEVVLEPEDFEGDGDFIALDYILAEINFIKILEERHQNGETADL